MSEFHPGQRMWDGDYLHEVVAAAPGAPWPQVYTRIIARRKDNVVRPALWRKAAAEPER